MDNNREEKLLNIVIVSLLTTVLLFYGWDFYSQYTYYSWKNWEQYYSAASASSIVRWKDSWRIEAMNEGAAILSNKVARMVDIFDNPPKLTPFTSTVENPGLFQRISAAADFRYFQTQLQPQPFYIACGSYGLQFLRVSASDFRCNAKIACSLYCSSMTDRDRSDPLWMFQVEPVGFDDDDDEEGAAVTETSTTNPLSKHFKSSFSLRNIATNKLISAHPPSNGINWKLALSYTFTGATETFQLNARPLQDGPSRSSSNSSIGEIIVDDDEISDFALAGYLYSSVSQSFAEHATHNTAGNGIEAGQIALHPNYDGVEFIDPLLLVFSPVNRDDVITAEHAKQASTSISKLVTPLTSPEYIPFDDKHCSIAILVPMTSKGTEMQSARESPVWPNLFSSFLDSIDWHTNTCKFGFYFGFDFGDRLYDTGDAWSELRETFHSIAKRHVKYLMEGDEKKADGIVNSYLMLKLMHFEDLSGAPAQIVSRMSLQAANIDHYEYLYQVNDDTIIVTPNWPKKFVSVLVNSPIAPNLGMTGPTDTNNHKIFTHAFVHKTHLDIFGFMFAPAFKNWWSDDWISLVYGNSHTFWNDDYTVTHNVDSQKSSGTTRYEVDAVSEMALDKEIAAGMLAVNQWLNKKGLQLLPLPNICGYFPLAHEMIKKL